MKTNSPRLEFVAIFALVVTLAATIYYWPYVDQAFRRGNNLLGQTNVHVPTSDLFLWAVFALAAFFGTRFWAYVGPRVFELSPDRSHLLRSRLQLLRVAANGIFLFLTLRTIHTHVPDFIDKLPWP